MLNRLKSAHKKLFFTLLIVQPLVVACGSGSSSPSQSNELQGTITGNPFISSLELTVNGNDYNDTSLKALADDLLSCGVSLSESNTSAILETSLMVSYLDGSQEEFQLTSENPTIKVGDINSDVFDVRCNARLYLDGQSLDSKSTEDIRVISTAESGDQITPNNVSKVGSPGGNNSKMFITQGDQ